MKGIFIMISEYKYREIEKALKNDLDKYETLTTLWGNVSYKAKKDGTPFKTLSKNIIGAEVRQKRYATHVYEKELVVCGWTKDGQFVSDGIDLYVPTKYASASYLKKKQNIDNEIYYLDLEDVKICIADKIEYCNKMNKSYEYEKEHLREICETCDGIKQKLRSSMNTSSYYMAVEYLKYILY